MNQVHFENGVLRVADDGEAQFVPVGIQPDAAPDLPIDDQGEQAGPDQEGDTTDATPVVDATPVKPSGAIKRATKPVAP